MTSGQKVIKYIAIGLALFIIVNIIGGLILLLMGILSLTGLINEENVYIDANLISGEVSEVNKLDIDLAFSSLKIKNGESFKVETNNKNVSYEYRNNEVIIKEKGKRFGFNKKNTSEVVVYIPSTLKINELEVETGAGETIINKLDVNILDLELGAGRVNINKVNALKSTSIETGAGEVVISDSTFNNASLETGAGRLEFAGIISGNSNIESGIGEVEIRLVDKLDNYTIKANKGIGSIKIKGENISNNTSYGSGDSLLTIDGGVGNINITE